MALYAIVMANRLIDSTSPYLLQHAHNPVDWYPWGEEAFNKARAEAKPIFLSIGYAACHWCHVMEREVFENQKIAELMNQHFVNIKVDREERPDLDDLYMMATQIMSGSGGWPMSVWLTPELEPFYAGTYFPPVDGYGRPGFPRLELGLIDAWKNRRADLVAQSRHVVEAIRDHSDESGAETQNLKLETGNLQLQTRDWIRLALEQAADRFDEVNGGIGGAPKFPPHQTLQLWLAILGDPEGGGLSGAERGILGRKLAVTLDGMMNGGIYDHVGGGFARYSTDAKWLVPHFEKMLYDSAQLAPVYARAGRLFENPEYARIARETLDFFLREMKSAEGAFYSSLDADSQGEEGKYYVWTIPDVRAALSAGDDADLIIQHFGMTSEGNWHETPVPGGSVLMVAEPAGELAEKHGITAAAMRDRLDGLLARMRSFRTQRASPGLDDKILTSWNGLMLSALAIAGSTVPAIGHDATAKYSGAAAELAEFLLAHHMKDGHLLRVSRGGGTAHTPGFLDDHAFFLNGLMDLIAATAESPARTRFLLAAQSLADSLIEQFEDKSHGGFYFTGPRHEKLFARMKSAADNATPSPNGVAIRALLRLAAWTGNDAYRRTALRAVHAFHVNVARRPEYFPTLLLGLFEDAAARPEVHVQPTLAARFPSDAASEHLQLSIAPIAPASAGGTFQVVLRLTIAPGFHIQSASAYTPSIQTTVRVRSEPAEILASQQWDYPELQNIGSVEGYSDTIEIQAHCTAARNAPAGMHTIRATLFAQPCTETNCVAPEQVSVEATLEIR
ncbi:MAG TPA: DUF255 domain-containing protein [Phycisphaerae bacterium]|jgi:hypothetical protein